MTPVELDIETCRNQLPTESLPELVQYLKGTVDKARA